MAKTPPQYPKGTRDQLADLIRRCGPIFDTSKDVEIQTDKQIVKLVPCIECARPIAVNTFYAPAIAVCRYCDLGRARERGESQIVQAGRTDPAFAANLEDCLINPAFAHAECPLGGEEHRMELKWVAVTDRYGPSEYAGMENGKPTYRQVAPGETVMHQCLDCRCCVTYTTTAVAQFNRINEPRSGKHINGFVMDLGIRVEEEEEASGAAS